MEARRLETGDEEGLKALRRGWIVGSEQMSPARASRFPFPAWWGRWFGFGFLSHPAPQDHHIFASPLLLDGWQIWSEVISNLHHFWLLAGATNLGDVVARSPTKTAK
jgi:hypothetical protein